tara:strand:+ start:74 stop:538 length:465 start_codon:yes stop_codon:yes gene_type:complete
MRLSNNFYLSEFTRSATAQRLGIENEPNIEQVNNIQKLVDNLLQKIRDKIGAIRVTSGFRCVDLCLALGSKMTSQHTKGEACDIQYHVDGTMQNKILFDAIIEHGEFDQLINEYNFSWIHVSYSEKNRCQVLEARKNKQNKTFYIDITKKFTNL